MHIDVEPVVDLIPITFMHRSDITQPAHHTKHLPVLAYPLNSVTFHLVQRDDGTSNGTALWLGAQVLSIYLSAEFKGKSRKIIETGTDNNASDLCDTARPKAVELGSGIGLMACVCLSINKREEDRSPS